MSGRLSRSTGTGDAGRRAARGRLAAALLAGWAAAAMGQVSNQILSLSPASAAQGTGGLTVTFTLDTDAPPAPPAGVLPNRVTIGSVTGSAVAHGSQYSVTAQFSFPATNALGLQDAAIVFSTPNGTVTFGTSQAFRVTAGSGVAAGFTVVDTGQTQCYNLTAAIAAPAAGQPFYGQDAQCAGPAPSYALSDDGLTVRDHRTGLVWQRSPDTTGDAALTAGDKLTWAGAQARPAVLNAAHHGGYSDWRLPTIKELYSLIDFRGADPSGLEGSDTSGLTPYLDTNYFRFAYGDTAAGERIIDSQYASSTLYVSQEFEQELFGVNFADGRIKGYGLSLGGSDKTFFVQCVRGNPSYGLNLFVDNGDGTIADRATGLMWARADSGAGLNWSNALAWVQARNAAQHLGHSDWRLPNAKELQSLVDYTRSPHTTGTAAIDPVFACTVITNEGGQVDSPWYWSGTTHASYNGSGHSGAYVCFGRGLGYMNSAWVDIHGAGCQRSDPKGGSLSSYTYTPYGYYNSLAPQGDAIRIDNYVRLVRDYPANADSVGDGIPDWWRALQFGGNGMTTNAASCASADLDVDGMTTLQEYQADTCPTNEASRLAFIAAHSATNVVTLTWVGGVAATQVVEYCASPAVTNGPWQAWLTNAPPTKVTNAVPWPGASSTGRFYRLRAWR